MPHLIIELAEDAVRSDEIPSLVDAVHQVTTDSGLFESGHIKTRAYPVAHYRVGTVDRPFIHAQLRIKAERTNAQKQALSKVVLEAIRAQALAAGVVTVEVVEMDQASYAKYEV